MLTSASELAPRILAGEVFLLAAEEEVLLSLPKGDWIGGTIPYFMDSTGGTISREAVYATPLPSEATGFQIVAHDPSTLPGICTEAPENGFSFILLPATSQVHVDFAHNAPEYPGIYMKPLLGWITGVHLDDLGKKQPKVVDGRTGSSHADKALVLHASLPPDKVARIGIVNLFHPGVGATITFLDSGFSAARCRIDGVERDFASWLAESGIDTRLPLVADYNGALVNVSFQAVDETRNLVTFYAPVFKGVEYRIASPVMNYIGEFLSVLPQGLQSRFSCNCILNFLYSSLEGKATKGMEGPITFGEVAYQLLNQTLVYLTIESRTT